MKPNMPRIRTEVQVMFFDTDCAAVVHNIAYLRFIEINRTLLAEKLGLPLVQMGEEKKYPVVVRTEIDYRSAARLGDKLVVDGWLDQIERVRFWCAFRIARTMIHSSPNAGRRWPSSKCHRRNSCGCRKTGTNIARTRWPTISC